MLDKDIFTKLSAMLSFNPETGAITWRIRRGRSGPAGTVAGRVRRDGYRYITIDRKGYMTHRIAWLITYGCFPAAEIDHINGNRSDNRISNLRDVNRGVNQQNQKSAKSNNKSSGLLGVTWNRGRWTSNIRTEGKIQNLGRFDTKEDAYQAYLRAKRLLHVGCTI